jgi:uncharacterized membrane protein
MYALLSRPEGWRLPDDVASAGTSGLSTHPSLVHRGSARASVPFALHMQQNRSTFPEAGHGALVAILGLCFAATIAPAIKGYYIVPIAVLLAMSALVLALEIFERQPVPSETLDVDFERLTVRDHRGRKIELPSYWTHIDIVRPAPYDLRLFLRCRDRSIQIGCCIGIEERKKVAILIGAALAHVRGGA